MLLAAVLVVGFIGMTSPSSIFAQYYDDDYESQYNQYYDDDYEKSYEKYMKDDNPKVSIKKININCDNSNRNPSDNNVDRSNAFDLPNGDSQSGQDRMNSNKDSNQKGNFKVICQNNNNNIKNVIVNGDITNEQQNNPTISACNTVVQPENPSVENSFNNVNGSASAFNAQTVCTDNVFENIINGSQPFADTESGVTANSISNIGQSSVLSQQIKSLQNDNGIKIQHQANIDIIQSQLASQSQQSSSTSPTTMAQGIEDSSELTATEKITKLKTQWLNQLP
jgi:hypothetical protein